MDEEERRRRRAAEGNEEFDGVGKKYWRQSGTRAWMEGRDLR